MKEFSVGDVLHTAFNPDVHYKVLDVEYYGNAQHVYLVSLRSGRTLPEMHPSQYFSLVAKEKVEDEDWV